MKAQQYDCPNKTCKMVTAVDMPTRMGQSYKGSIQRLLYKGESVSPGMCPLVGYPIPIGQTQPVHIRGVLYGLSRHIYKTINNKERRWEGLRCHGRCWSRRGGKDINTECIWEILKKYIYKPGIPPIHLISYTWENENHRDTQKDLLNSEGRERNQDSIFCSPSGFLMQFVHRFNLKEESGFPWEDLSVTSLSISNPGLFVSTTKHLLLLLTAWHWKFGLSKVMTMKSKERNRREIEHGPWLKLSVR